LRNFNDRVRGDGREMNDRDPNAVGDCCRPARDCGDELKEKKNSKI